MEAPLFVLGMPAIGGSVVWNLSELQLQQVLELFRASKNLEKKLGVVLASAGAGSGGTHPIILSRSGKSPRFPRAGWLLFSHLFAFLCWLQRFGRILCASVLQITEICISRVAALGSISFISLVIFLDLTSHLEFSIFLLKNLIVFLAACEKTCKELNFLFLCDRIVLSELLGI